MSHPPYSVFADFKATIDARFQNEERLQLTKPIASVIRFLMNDNRIRNYTDDSSVHKNMLEYIAWHYANHPKLAPLNWAEINDVIVGSLLYEERHAQIKMMSLVSLFKDRFKDYDINAAGADGITILMAANFNGKTDAGHLRFLVERGADVDALSIKNGRVLHFIEHIRDEIALVKFNYLVSAGSDPLEVLPFARFDNRARKTQTDYDSFHDYMSKLKDGNSDMMPFGKLKYIEAIIKVTDNLKLAIQPSIKLHHTPAQKRRIKL